MLQNNMLPKRSTGNREWWGGVIRRKDERVMDGCKQKRINYKRREGRRINWNIRPRKVRSSVTRSKSEWPSEIITPPSKCIHKETGDHKDTVGAAKWYRKDATSRKYRENCPTYHYFQIYDINMTKTRLEAQPLGTTEHPRGEVYINVTRRRQMI